MATSRLVTRTRFTTIKIPVNNTKGLSLGQGSCIGVKLQLPANTLNTEVANPVPYVYFGDSSEQQFELLAGEVSPTIYCEDLSQVFVRCPAFDEITDVMIEVLIYDE